MAMRGRLLFVLQQFFLLEVFLIELYLWQSQALCNEVELSIQNIIRYGYLFNNRSVGRYFEKSFYNLIKIKHHCIKTTIACYDMKCLRRNWNYFVFTNIFLFLSPWSITNPYYNTLEGFFSSPICYENLIQQI